MPSLICNAVLVWISFAFVSHGERLHIANGESKSPLAQRQELNEHVKQLDVQSSDPRSRQLARLLLTFKPAAAFRCNLQHGRVARKACKSLRAPAEPCMSKCPHAAALTLDDALVSKISKLSNEGKVMAWVEGFIARHDLCPWAAGAAREDKIKVVMSDAKDEAAFLTTLKEEASALTDIADPGLATTLVACTGKWAQDFTQFDAFLQNADVSPLVKLVSFHPDFSRWRAADVKVGDAVMSYHWKNYGRMEETLAQLEAEDEDEGEVYDEEYLEQLVQDNFGEINDPKLMEQLKAGLAKDLDEEQFLEDVRGDGEAIDDEDEFLMRAEREMREQGLLDHSDEPARGVIVDMEEERVGPREVLVRFEHGEEYIPTEWIVSRDNQEPCQGPPLADNFLHRCPLPVAHLLRNDILGDVTDDVGDDTIADLQLQNAKLMRRAARMLRRKP
mmetsp:Transcript_80833/g.152776  ORF Transcript_80833/g.152776 Transcript_80833/m.152776 type:complete len:446 (+) Transcript_80833:74-1411(+)